MDSVLTDVYYSPTSPACFAGVNAVLKEARKQISTIKIEDVNRFMHGQTTYTLHKPVRRRFTRNQMRSPAIDAKWQADLIDWQNIKQHNRNVAYVLVCLDVLSRYAFVEPVKQKTPVLVAKAFEKILLREKRHPWIIYTDRGNEFGQAFKDMLKDYDIRHVYATDPDVKCAMVERYIRTLKTRLWKYFSKNNTYKFLDVLQSVVRSINNSHHRTLGQTPASVKRSDEDSLWNHLYGDSHSTGGPVYNVGDRVRIVKEKSIVSKGYHSTFTKEVFTVERVMLNRRPIAYKLKGVDGAYYKEQLVLVL